VVVPLSTTLDSPGAMTRSDDDCILLDSVLAGAPLDTPPLTLKGLRLGLMLAGSGMSDARILAIARAVEAALRERE